VAACWQSAVTVPAPAVAAFAAALEEIGDAVVSLESADGTWRVAALSNDRPDPVRVRLVVALAAAAAGIPAPPPVIEPVADRDWRIEGFRLLPAVRAGRFFVRGGHVREPVPFGAIGIRLEASLAFGSGHHASTAGCLAALSALAHRPVRRLLDMGCGSGILAIAAARLWRARVIAADIDADAVAETAANARLNGVAPLVRPVVADGYRSPPIRHAGPFDVIAANILAHPLVRMAADLAAALGPGGRAVLAGFMARDAARVRSAHAAFGLRLERALDVDGWTTLTLVASGPPSARSGYSPADSVQRLREGWT
jgi:ribosomal protein L11 methyltransferase